MTDDSPLRVAIVGAGPSGFYAAGQLLGRRRAGVRRRPVRPPADAVRARAVGRGSGPSEDQVGHEGVRQDHRARALSVLRTRRAGDRRQPPPVAGALPRGRLHARHLDRQTARDPRRGAARIAPGHGVRGLVQRPSGPHRAWRSISRPSMRWWSAPGTSPSTWRECSRWRRRSWLGPTRPTTRCRCSRTAGSRRSRSSPAAARCKPRSPIRSCWRWASSSAAMSRSSGATWTSCPRSRWGRRTRPAGATSRSSRTTRRGRRPASRSPSAFAFSPLRSSCSATRTATCAR